VDSRFLHLFREEYAPRLRGAVVRRVVCVAEGLILELQAQQESLELALWAPTGAAWVCCLDASARSRLHEELGSLAPGLVARVPEELAWKVMDATALDALRAWLVRPAAGVPEWFRLERARIDAVRTEPGDRRLWIDFSAADAAGSATQVELMAELFDRGANFILRGEVEIANWRQRQAAPDRHSTHTPRSGEATDSAYPVWDAASRSVRPGNEGDRLSLLGAAHLVLAGASVDTLLRARRQETRRIEKRLRARVRKLEVDAQRALAAPRWRRLGELLTANLHRVKRGNERVTVEDFYAGGAPVEIDLDPKRSPQENVDLMFKRARRGERGLQTIESRLQEARSELEKCVESAAQASPEPDAATWPQALRTATEQWRAAVSSASLRIDLRRLWAAPEWEKPLAAPTRGRALPNEDAGPGRIFTLAGGWEVRVGRSNEENDELTHRFARPDDVWLHASGAPGSHVVLRMQGRSGNPPRDVLEAAASIAARFSKAKHSGTVAVIWTRKRYVRKPRRAKPGLAVCTHEKTLFVRPGLPEADAEGEA
jgi:predicted ribosome quality control (RQC) complex YloA/Tae2 family protein